MQRYTFPATDKANVLLNAGQSLHKTVSTKVEILDNRTVRTRHHRQRLLPGHQAVHRLHDHPLRPAVHHVRHLEGRHGHRGLESLGRHGPRRRVRPLRHDQGPHASRRPPRSRTSTRAARRSTSAPRAAVRSTRPGTRRRRAWEDRLDDVRAQGGSDTLRRTFYSSLYRSFLAPEHRQRRRRPLHRLGPEDPPRQGLHLLPELVAVGHLPHPGAAPVAARAA